MKSHRARCRVARTLNKASSRSWSLTNTIDKYQSYLVFIHRHKIWGNCILQTQFKLINITLYQGFVPQFLYKFHRILTIILNQYRIKN